MSKLILVRGLPGSGKSTFSDILKGQLEIDNLRVCQFEADMYFYESGVYKFSHNKLRIAHEWCQDSTQEALLSYDVVIVSNTFTTHHEMKWYLDLYEYNLCSELEAYRCTGNYGVLSMEFLKRQCRK